MKIRLQHHLILLVLFASSMVVLWMLPVWVMGYPYELPELAALRTALETGELGNHASTRLLPWLMAPFAFPLGWQNVIAWLQLNAGALGLSLLFLWWVVYRVFSIKIAWLTVVIFAFMPVHWLQALRLDGYAFAYIFLFLALALGIEVKKSATKPWLYLLLTGVCYGLTLALRDAFILFLPGVVVAIFYLGRKDAGKTLTGLLIFLAAAFLVYSSPIIPQVLETDASPIEKVQLFIGAQRGKPSPLHFYPDMYTYEFAKEAYLERIAKEVDSWSLLNRIRAENYMQAFGASERTLLSNFLVGTWLFLGSLPLLITQDYVGGVFLWLFIIPGGIYLYRKNSQLFWLLLWLTFSLMITIRYAFLAQRSHIMDYGWVLALLAGLGVAIVIDKFKSGSVKLNIILTGFIPLVVVLQLLQANRTQIARLYHKSNVLEIYAAAEALEALPDTAVVAYSPARRDYFYLTQINSIQFNPSTIQQLDEERLQFAFDYYNVTHAIGYSRVINQQLPASVTVVNLPAKKSELRPPSILIEMLLNWFR